MAREQPSRLRRFLPRAAVLALTCGFLGWIGVRLTVATPRIERRAVLEQFAERFSKDIYPLMSREQNGCKACHFADSPRMFRVLETPRATYSLLLEQELFHLQDPMAIVARLLSGDPEMRMPKAGQWTAPEIARLRDFAADLLESLNSAGEDGPSRPDERFPDSLLLPYDGASKEELVARTMSFYQLRHSFGTVFGKQWLAASGRDPFEGKAHIFGGADFRSSFEISRTLSANYLTGLQEVAREVARRYVSAPEEVLFPGFDPNLFVARSRKKSARNIDVLYNHILWRDPTRQERDAALELVADLQQRRETNRTVRFTLTARDPDGREDRAQIDVQLRRSGAYVARFLLDQTQEVPEGQPWVQIGAQPFRFEAGNLDHFVRLAGRPGNDVTAFDAVRFVAVENGIETGEEIVLDNVDPECTLEGDWQPIRKDGDMDRNGKIEKKYDQDLHVVGPNHYESRTLANELRYATMTLRLPRDGDYNVYLSWPAIPHRTSAALVEIHSATPPTTPAPVVTVSEASEGFATVYMDQTESTLNEYDHSQWQPFHRQVYLGDADDFVQISNRGVDSTKHVIVADAVKFVPLGGGEEIVVDNRDSEGCEQSEGWAPDELTKGSPGRGKMYGDDMLHYPPSENGNPLKDQTVDPTKQVWVRYRPLRDGKYVPGWYSVYLWSTGGVTHSDWVPVEIHGTQFGPVVGIEAPPMFGVGEIAALNATRSYHPAGKQVQYQWTHDAADLGLRLEGGDTLTPRFVVPELASARPGWAGLIEAMLQHPEFLMPSGGPQAPPRPQLARVALDLVGRVPTEQEFRRFETAGRLAPVVDAYLDSEDFQQFFFHRTRAELMSRGDPESDEPARLWTYLAMNDISYRDLFTADYTVDANWQRAPRPSEHGRTGILTMKGYLIGKPGLPSFTYPAKVLTLTMGIVFEVSDAVASARKNVVSTTDPASICYSCHKLLTPLALQRERWDVHGDYRTTDDKGEPIDDSDQGVVPDYPFKGQGLDAFATQVVQKEKFVRAFINLHHDMLFHRKLRIFEDHRAEYKELYDFAMRNDLKIRPLLKRMVLMENGEPWSGEGKTLGAATEKPSAAVRR